MKLNLNHSPMVIRQEQIVKQFVKSIPNIKNLLEVGCGDGILLLQLEKYYEKAKGIDFSPLSYEKARKNSKYSSKITVEQKDLFEFNDKEYDVCLLIATLEHICNDKEAIKRMNKLTKKDGYMILGVPAHKKYFGLHDKKSGHFRRYERKELISKLENEGFRIKKFYTICFPIGNIILSLYNFLLKTCNEEKNIKNKKMVERIKSSAPNIKNTFPKWSKIFNLICIPIRYLMLIDKLFLNTDKGTYYMVLAQKEDYR